MARKDPAALRDEAAVAVERGKFARAAEIYGELEALDPSSPTWPKRIGEVCRKAGNMTGAIIAFERAADRFINAGFLVQAIAVCKLILQIDPQHSATVNKLASLSGPPSKPATTARKPPTASAPPTIAAALVAHAQSSAAIVVSSPPREDVVRTRPKVTLTPGAALETLEISTLVPNSRKVLDEDGQDSGVMIIPIDDIVEIELEADHAERSGIELAIDELELVPVDPDLPEPMGIDPEARTALSNTPLFAKLPPTSLEDLIPRIGMEDYKPGDLVFKEGDAGATLYVISEGEVVVETGGRELARLGPSAFFGEIALVTELPRSATVRCVTNVELLSITRDVLREASAVEPAIVNVVLQFLRDRLVDRLAHTGELFRGFTEGERTALTKRFELVEVARDATLITQDKRADGLYVMLAGKVTVKKTGEATPLATLTSGDVFGEMSLLSGGGSVANVCAITRVLALRMPSRVFHEVIMTHPQVLEYLGELAARRTPATPTDGVVDLHLDLL